MSTKVRTELKGQEYMIARGPGLISTQQGPQQAPENELSVGSSPQAPPGMSPKLSKK